MVCRGRGSVCRRPRGLQGDHRLARSLGSYCEDRGIRAGGAASLARPALSLDDGGGGADSVGYGFPPDPRLEIRVGDSALDRRVGAGGTRRLAYPACLLLAGFLVHGRRLRRSAKRMVRSRRGIRPERSPAAQARKVLAI